MSERVLIVDEMAPPVPMRKYPPYHPAMILQRRPHTSIVVMPFLSNVTMAREPFTIFRPAKAELERGQRIPVRMRKLVPTWDKKGLECIHDLPFTGPDLTEELRRAGVTIRKAGPGEAAALANA